MDSLPFAMKELVTCRTKRKNEGLFSISSGISVHKQAWEALRPCSKDFFYKGRQFVYENAYQAIIDSRYQINGRNSLGNGPASRPGDGYSLTFGRYAIFIGIRRVRPT